jgi:hypothetical protein
VYKLELSKKEQLELLEKLNTSELQEKFGWEELYDLFTISRDEYVEWEIERPLSSGIRTKREIYDGLYFIEHDGSYEVYWKERGKIDGRESFSDYKIARRYLAKGTTPYFLYKEHRVHKEFNDFKCTPNKTIKAEKTIWLRQIARFFRLS